MENNKIQKINMYNLRRLKISDCFFYAMGFGVLAGLIIIISESRPLIYLIDDVIFLFL